MRTLLRHPSQALTIVLAIAAPTPGLLAPATAFASTATQVERAAQHAERVAERAARRDAHERERAARRAARLAARAARQAEREERRATRAGATHAGGPTGGDAETSPASEPRGDCSIAASADATRVAPGAAVVISGTLSCSTASEAAEQTVTVYLNGRGASSGGPAIEGTVTTASDGAFQYHSAALTTRSAFTLQTPSARRQARVVVLIAAQVTLQGPVPSGAALAQSGGREAGGTATVAFTGVVSPEQSDLQVGLRARFGDGEWRTIAFTHTDAEGRFTFSHRFKFAGEVTLAARTIPRGGERTESPALTYSIAQAQNPTLTIQLASVPATVVTNGAASTLGSATTISGVALGSPNRTVTLLALAPDGRFTPVASIQSDATGAYSFTVDPTTSTIYRVLCHARRSAPIRVEVSPPAPAAPAS
ncbi:MAG TPA: hypothetical protein VGX69_05010 [Solirubrobacteraceae bacterium]|nr:hypothetical protein [Solirubrobacteraceae bacterium]